MSSHRIPYRFHPLHWLQGLRSGLQGMERSPRRTVSNGWALSYDNTGALGHSTWRHVIFVEGAAIPGWAATRRSFFPGHFLSDVCKHCENAGCLEACPTGSIVRTEFGGVYVQPDVCNGCGYCVVACPFGVVERNPDDGRAFKCTFCYDRQREGLKPACATACPTESIKFGEIEDMREAAAHARGGIARQRFRRRASL